MYEKERWEMVERLVSYGFLRDEKVAEAMRKVPRHLFAPQEMAEYAYEDRPLPIEEGQTISAPHMVAMMCDAMDFVSDNKVLEIGAGTGYHACVVAQIVKEVYSIERLESLAARAIENLEKADCGRVKVIVGDGTMGYSEEAPYDKIYVTAGAPDLPKPLLDQLKPDGKLLIPIGRRYFQDLMLYEKTQDGELITRSLGACAFVPLIGEYGWVGEDVGDWY